VEAHGGEIGLRSAPRAGATFWFTLPKTPPGRSAIPSGTHRATASGGVAGGALSALPADASFLQGGGEMGDIDGVDALDYLAGCAELPQLIPLDLMMPRMNGVEFREAMLKVPAWSAIPVIVITAEANARKRVEGLAAAGFPAETSQAAGALRAHRSHNHPGGSVRASRARVIWCS
jgi:CheY-like chemotaxis protein